MDAGALAEHACLGMYAMHLDNVCSRAFRIALASNVGLMVAEAHVEHAHMDTLAMPADSAFLHARQIARANNVGLMDVAGHVATARKAMPATLTVTVFLLALQTVKASNAVLMDVAMCAGSATLDSPAMLMGDVCLKQRAPQIATASNAVPTGAEGYAESVYPRLSATKAKGSAMTRQRVCLTVLENSVATMVVGVCAGPVPPAIIVVIQVNASRPAQLGMPKRTLPKHPTIMGTNPLLAHLVMCSNTELVSKFQRPQKSDPQAVVVLHKVTTHLAQICI
jgi:hypothetical protein